MKTRAERCLDTNRGEERAGKTGVQTVFPPVFSSDSPPVFSRDALSCLHELCPSLVCAVVFCLIVAVPLFVCAPAAQARTGMLAANDLSSLFPVFPQESAEILSNDVANDGLKDDLKDVSNDISGESARERFFQERCTGDKSAPDTPEVDEQARHGLSPDGPMDQWLDTRQEFGREGRDEKNSGKTNRKTNRKGEDRTPGTAGEGNTRRIDRGIDRGIGRKAEERSAAPSSDPSFDPSSDLYRDVPRSPQNFDALLAGPHPRWKGRKQLPLGFMKKLCYEIASYMGFPRENTTFFLLEIAAAESDFGYYVRQVRGPAQSPWQIEPATARDMHTRLHRRNAVMYRKILALRDTSLSEEENVVTNLHYACAMCLGVLYLKGIRFETLTTLEARARAWKKYYNTYLGKGTLEGYCQKAMRYVGSSLSGIGDGDDMPDTTLLASNDNIFAQRDHERFLSLPPDFDASPMGRYYVDLLKTHPEAFEEVPDALLASQSIHDIALTLLWELLKKVQANPASIGAYANMPKAILDPLVSTAMHQNALQAYPNLPSSYKNDPMIRKIYDSHKFMREYRR